MENAAQGMSMARAQRATLVENRPQPAGTEEEQPKPRTRKS